MKRLTRIWHSLRFTLAKGMKKKRYVDKHNLFAEYGERVVFQPHLLPLYSNLIKIHNDVVVGRNVEFVTHDLIHRVFNSSDVCPNGFKEKIGCIEVLENTFIGNGSIIMYGVTISRNNIIAAGSVVTKSTEPNSIYAGVPAKKIGEFSETAKKRLFLQENRELTFTEHNQNLTKKEIENAWTHFYLEKAQQD